MTSSHNYLQSSVDYSRLFASLQGGGKGCKETGYVKLLKVFQAFQTGSHFPPCELYQLIYLTISRFNTWVGNMKSRQTTVLLNFCNRQFEEVRFAIFCQSEENFEQHSVAICLNHILIHLGFWLLCLAVKLKQGRKCFEAQLKRRRVVAGEDQNEGEQCRLFADVVQKGQY